MTFDQSLTLPWSRPNFYTFLNYTKGVVYTEIDVTKIKKYRFGC